MQMICEGGASGWALRLLFCLACCLTLTHAMPRDAAASVTITSSENPYPGVTIERGHLDSPQRWFWVTFISLCTDYIHVTATEPAADFVTTGSR